MIGQRKLLQQIKSHIGILTGPSEEASSIENSIRMQFMNFHWKVLAVGECNAHASVQTFMEKTSTLMEEPMW